MQIKDITFGLPLRRDEMRIEKVSRMVEWKRWKLRRWMVSIIKNGRMKEMRWDHEKEWSVYSMKYQEWWNPERKRESGKGSAVFLGFQFPNEFWFFSYLYSAARVLFLLDLGLFNPLEFRSSSVFSVFWDPEPKSNQTKIFWKTFVQTKPYLKYYQIKFLFRSGSVWCSVFHQISYTSRDVGEVEGDRTLVVTQQRWWWGLSMAGGCASNGLGGFEGFVSNRV